LDKHAVLPLIGSKKPRVFYGYIIVIATLCITAIAYGTLFSFGVFLKPLSTELGWTRAMTSGAYSLNYLLIGLLGIVMGRLNDRFGPRIIMVGCGFFLGLGYLLMSQISAIWQLYLFYGVMVGIGMSAVFIPASSTVARWFSKRRGLMTGIIVLGHGMCLIIMSSLGSHLISSYGWRISYLIVGIIAALVILLAAQFLRRDPSQVGQLPDGESGGELKGLIPDARGFSLREATHIRQFWMLCALFFCHGVGQQGVMVHIVPYATDLGISGITVSNILAVIGGLFIVGTVVMGSVIDRVGNKPTLIIVLISVTAVLFWLAVARGLWVFYLLAAIFGFSFGGMVTVQSPIVAELFGLRAHGSILGAVIFVLTIGCAIGPLLAGCLFDMTGGYSLSFLLYGVLSIISLILALLLKPTCR
jgi:MFS family permease